MTSGRYEVPLDAARMAEQQAVERARLCDRLETMWQGLQQDVEYQRETSERGVDPRSQALQLQVIKLQATLWRMTGAPLVEPEPEVDPATALVDARGAAAKALDAVNARLAAAEAKARAKVAAKAAAEEAAAGAVRRDRVAAQGAMDAAMEKLEAELEAGDTSAAGGEAAAGWD